MCACRGEIGSRIGLRGQGDGARGGNRSSGGPGCDVAQPDDHHRPQPERQPPCEGHGFIPANVGRRFNEAEGLQLLGFCDVNFRNSRPNPQSPPRLRRVCAQIGRSADLRKFRSRSLSELNQNLPRAQFLTIVPYGASCYDPCRKVAAASTCSSREILQDGPTRPSVLTYVTGQNGLSYSNGSA